MNIKFSATVNKELQHKLDKYLNEYFDLKPRLANMERVLEEDDPVSQHMLVFGKQKELEQIRAEIEYILHEHDLKLVHHETTYDQWLEVKEI